jgi:hypothetical protein
MIPDPSNFTNRFTDTQMRFFFIFLYMRRRHIEVSRGTKRCIPFVKDNLDFQYSNQEIFMLYCFCFTTWEDRAMLRSNPSAHVGL